MDAVRRALKDAPRLTDPACLGSDPKLWEGPKEREAVQSRADRLREAQQVCHDCPDLVECSTWAQRRVAEGKDIDGIYGGEMYGGVAGGVTFETRRCAYSGCDIEFIGFGRNRYHSVECRIAARRERQRKR